MREEREVDGELQQGDGPELAPIRVDDVAERLEGEERDADRREDRPGRRGELDPERSENARGTLGEESLVFEPAEHGQVDGHGRYEPRPANALLVVGGNDHGQHLVDHGRCGQQGDEVPVVVAVEDVAGEKNEDVPPGEPGEVEPAGDPQAGQTKRNQSQDDLEGRGPSVVWGQRAE